MLLLTVINILSNAYIWHKANSNYTPNHNSHLPHIHDFGQIVGILKITSWFYYKLQLYILENCFT